MSWPHLLEWECEGGGLRGGGVRVAGELEDLLGVLGVGACVLGCDPDEQVGLAGQEQRTLDGVVGAGLAMAYAGEVVGELGYVGGGDMVVVSSPGFGGGRVVTPRRVAGRGL